MKTHFIKHVQYLLKKKKNKSISLNNIQKFIDIKKPIEEIISLHSFLTESVLSITNCEKSTKNDEMCGTTTDISLVLLQCEDKKSAGKMYMFNKDNRVYYIFGDIHSDSKTLMYFLKKLDIVRKINKGQDIVLLFLGDYIDRGKEKFKSIELMLLLKYLFCENVFYLKGNHDGGAVEKNGEYSLCVGRNKDTTDDDYFVAWLHNLLKFEGKDMSLLCWYLCLFDNLSVMAAIKMKNETLFCVHGGIPRVNIKGNYNHITSLRELYLNEYTDHLGASVLHNIMWSDPKEDETFSRPTRRFCFYKNEFDEFVNKFNIQKVIRGHECFEEGYKEFFSSRLVSIFSTGSVPSGNDETAYPQVTPIVYEVINGVYKVIR